MKTQLLKSLFPGALALAMAGTALAQPTIKEIN